MSFIGSTINSIREGDVLGAIANGVSGIPVVGTGLKNIINISAGRQTFMEAVGDTVKGEAIGLGLKGVSSVTTGAASQLNNAISSAKGGSALSKGVNDIANNTVQAGNALIQQGTGPTLDKSLKTEVKVPGVQQAMNQITGKTDLVSNLKTKLPSTGGTPSQTLSLPSNTSQTTSTGNKLVNFAKKNITVSGVAQTALSGASMVAGAKQAKASNNVAQQSLLFQQQSYNEAKAEKESYKAGMKQTAQTAYESASLFGATLYGSDSNNTLLTNYNTNGNGNEGTYSILSWSPKSNKT